MKNLPNKEKKDKSVPPCRLFPIFARESNVAVIFRRGPSRFTQLILWNTDTDQFTNGQWFKGRIYERRSDLSPDGTRLIYFVSKFNRKTVADDEYTYAWTAISKPPYLTALALWPKGDCWHGGGLFQSNVSVLLNHKPEVSTPHKDHLPKKLRIISNPDASGEDDPIFSQRLDRDDWKKIKDWKITFDGRETYYKTQQPETREKRSKANRNSILLERSLNRLTYSERFVLKNGQNDLLELNGQGCWMDFDQSGRISVFNNGKLFVENQNSGDKLDLVELIDFNSNKPEFFESPDWAKYW